jgi:hypothetical protein
MIMFNLKRLPALAGFAATTFAATAASAHTSLAQHAHPHGDSLLLGVDGLLIAMVTAAMVVAGVALVVGRSRSGAAVSRRRKP